MPYNSFIFGYEPQLGGGGGGLTTASRCLELQYRHAFPMGPMHVMGDGGWGGGGGGGATGFIPK